MIGCFLFRPGCVIGCLGTERREARIRLCGAAECSPGKEEWLYPWYLAASGQRVRENFRIRSRAFLVGRFRVGFCQTSAFPFPWEREPAAGEWKGGRGEGTGSCRLALAGSRALRCGAPWTRENWERGEGKLRGREPVLTFCGRRLEVAPAPAVLLGGRRICPPAPSLF